MADAELQEDRPHLFRIGVNLGCVMIDDEDIYGDGVNAFNPVSKVFASLRSLVPNPSVKQV